MKKFLIYVSGLIAVCIGMQAYSDKQMQHDKLRYAQQAISQLYVDSIDDVKLVEDAINGMLKGLDPHSSYTNAEETRELNEPLEGNFSGIGVTFNLNKDTVYVLSTVPGGPSEKVGILAGDRIIASNDTVLAGVNMKRSDIMKHLRGPKGTKARLKVLRRSAGKADTINFVVTRAEIPIYSIDASYMVNDSTGYIRVNKFAAETSKEFREALSKLKNQGMRNLILDLEENGGGYLNASVELLSELLPYHSLAVYTKGNASERYNHFTYPEGSSPLLPDGRLVVLVNQYSASASEITSGAIQDYDRGVIVGRRTYGKGLVQRPIPFPDGSMMRLTVAHYYTPSGRDIQKPYEKGKTEEYELDILERFNSGELMHADSVHYDSTLKVKTLRLGREFYGGGGISPDVFVPLDTTEFTKYYRDLVAKGVINNFTIDFVDKNRKSLKKQFKNDDAFIQGFNITDEMWADLATMGSAEQIELNPEEFERSKPLIATILKALIGRDIYQDSTYYKVYNLHDPIFLKALEVITGPLYDELLSPPVITE